MLYGLLFFPMLMAFAVWILGKKSARARNFCAVLATACEFGLTVVIACLPDLSAGISGVAGLGIRLETDGFRKVYLVVIGFLWLMTTLLGNEYFSHYNNCDRYYFFNLMTLGATMGVFVAADLFTALIFFEIMSFTSYTWVIQEETEDAIKAANTYLAVAVIGGLAALMGLFLLWHTLGTTEIAKLYEAADACGRKGILYAAGGCVLFGFGAKAGMFPLHIWLPKAHPVAPAPASALLSGLLTKSGIFGVLVLSCRLFRYDSVWGTLILTLGTVTMILGALLALFSVDLKRTLACSSVSQIGFILIGIGMTVLLGTENALAARGTLLHMINHSLFKLVLFLSAAVVYMNLHALNLNEIRGFGRGRPLLLIPFLLGALGIGGFPFLNGYVSKTLLHESIVEYLEHAAAHGHTAFGMHAVEWLFLLSGGITVAYMTKLFVALFVERNPVRQQQFNEQRNCMNRVSAFALLASATVLPALGLTTNMTMNRIAEQGTDFFLAAPLAHAVNYLAWENLKGGLISIGIGFAIYFGFVRTVLMRKEGSMRVYVDLWPKRLDLEELLYRPALLKWFPGLLGPVVALFGENRISGPAAKAAVIGTAKTASLFGENRITGYAGRIIFRVMEVFSHGLSDLLDALVALIRKTV